MFEDKGNEFAVVGRLFLMDNLFFSHAPAEISGF